MRKLVFVKWMKDCFDKGIRNEVLKYEEFGHDLAYKPNGF